MLKEIGIKMAGWVTREFDGEVLPTMNEIMRGITPFLIIGFIAGIGIDTLVQKYQIRRGNKSHFDFGELVPSTIVGVGLAYAFGAIGQLR